MKRMMRDRRGVELTLNTVIIAILVVLVLVVVIGFFLGGTAKAKGTLTDIFSNSLAGTDVDVALVQCETWCEQAKSRPVGVLRTTSSYCTKMFNLDTNGDGKAETEGGDKVKNYECDDELLGVKCYDESGIDICKSATPPQATQPP